MDLSDYQYFARETAIYPNVGSNFVYPVLGLAGESGEVAEKVKKILRDRDGLVDDETKESLAKELGDVLWYLSQIASEFDLSLSDIAEANLEKLRSRQKRNTLHGSGDSR